MLHYYILQNQSLDFKKKILLGNFINMQKTWLNIRCTINLINKFLKQKCYSLDVQQTILLHAYCNP